MAFLCGRVCGRYDNSVRFGMVAKMSLNIKPMLGLMDPKTKKATAFYALLGVLVGDIWNRGINKWNLVALVLFAGLGSLTGLAHLIHGTDEDPPPDEPEAGNP